MNTAQNVVQLYPSTRTEIPSDVPTERLKDDDDLSTRFAALNISESVLYHVPHEFYPLISTGIPSDAPIKSLRASKDLLERLATLINVAMASKWTFIQSMNGLRGHSILRSLLSFQQTGQTPYNIHQALAPIAQCLKALRPFCNAHVPKTQEIFKIFSHIFKNLSPNFTKDVNIVASSPRPLYEVLLQQSSIDESTTSICDEEFERQDEGFYLTSCMKAVTDVDELNLPSNDKIVRAIRYHKGNFLQLPEHHRSTRAYALAVARHELYNIKDVAISFITALTPELKTDREFVLEVVARNSFALRFFPEFQNDKDVVLAAVRQDRRAWQYASEALQNDKDIAIVMIQQHNLHVGEFSDALRDDRDIVLAAVKKSGQDLLFASKKLQNDKDIVLTAVRQNGLALQYASETLRNDKEIVLAAVQQNGRALRCASEILRNDKEIVLAAVRQDGWILQFIDEALRNDKEIVLAAIRQQGQILQFASEALRNDKDVVLTAVGQDGRALQFASEALMDDGDIINAVVQQRPGIHFIYETSQNDKSAVLYILGKDHVPRHIPFARFQDNKERLRDLIKTLGGLTLRFAPKDLQNDKDVVLTTAKQDGRALQFASEALRNDKEIVLTAVRQDGWALQFAHEVLRNDKEIVLAAVQQNGRALQFASEALRNDKEIALAATMQNYCSARYIGDALACDDMPFLNELFRAVPLCYHEIILCQRSALQRRNTII